MRKKRVFAVIPARYESKRFPGKLLESVQGETILKRVIHRARLATKIDQLVLVSADESILLEARSCGVEVIKSQGRYICGTDRCASILKEYSDYDIILNIQADQPFLNPDHLDILIEKILSDDSIQIASLMSLKACTRIDESVVKVHVDRDKKAQKFTRQLSTAQEAYEHIGVYAFRKEILLQVAGMEPSTSEIKHSLEQLRWIDNGLQIQMVGVSYNGISINTPEDLEAINNDDTHSQP